MPDAGLEVKAFFTSRSGGVSVDPYDTLNVADHVGDDPAAVARNREIIAEQAGVPVVFLKPVHGAKAARITSADADVPEADILVTDTPGIALATLAADCVPLLVHDAATGAVAAAHIGRKGLYAGAVDNLVTALADLRGMWRDVEGMTASIGPAICGRCYEVPAEMRAQVAQRHPSAFATTRWNTPSLDLPRAIETRLGELGVDVIRSSVCTFEDPEYFSHRMHGTTGRQAGVIVCEGRGVSLP